MIKQIVVFLFILITVHSFGQSDDQNELVLKYNQRLNQIGYETQIAVSGNITDEQIYHRTIHWFRDENQKVRKVINLKDTIRINDTIMPTTTASGIYQIRKSTSGNYRINGRYFHPHRYRRFGNNNTIEICGSIEIIIFNGITTINFSNFKLPNYGYLSIEEELLQPGSLQFKRKYRKLKSEMGKITAAIADDLKFWIENYHDIMNGIINWQDFDDIDK